LKNGLLSKHKYFSDIGHTTMTSSFSCPPPESFSDPVFLEKFTTVPRRIKDWVGPHLDLSRATVLDFGCGEGTTALALALDHPHASIHGMDVEDYFHQLAVMARTQLRIPDLPHNLSFFEAEPGEFPYEEESLDLIYSWSVFEHLDERLMADVLRKLLSILKRGGLFFLNVRPLYYSPKGGHLHNFTNIDWLHLLRGHVVLKEEIYTPSAMIVPPEPKHAHRSFEEYRDLVWEVYENLNKIIADELRQFVLDSGFELLDEFRATCAQEPPDRLLQVYNRAILTTEEAQFLFRKPD
jgi:SAM-dependent methyltransferase